MTIRLDYLEIRPCVDFGDRIESYLGEPVDNGMGDTWRTPEAAYAEAQTALDAEGGIGPVFWTLYMNLTDGTAEALGDFKTFDAAYRAMSLLLMPMRRAADEIERLAPPKINPTAAELNDICNQSTTEERL